MKDDLCLMSEADDGVTKAETAKDRIEPLLQGYRGAANGSGDDQELLTDFLTDLMHWSHVTGVPFQTALRSAEMHFDHEHDEDEHDEDEGEGDEGGAPHGVTSPRDPTLVPLPDGEVRIFEPDPAEGDPGLLFVLDVLGVSVAVRQRSDMRLYVHVDRDATSAPAPGSEALALAVEVNNSGENYHGEDAV